MRERRWGGREPISAQRCGAVGLRGGGPASRKGGKLGGKRRGGKGVEDKKEEMIEEVEGAAGSYTPQAKRQEGDLTGQNPRRQHTSNQTTSQL